SPRCSTAGPDRPPVARGTPRATGPGRALRKENRMTTITAQAPVGAPVATRPPRRRGRRPVAPYLLLLPAVLVLLAGLGYPVYWQVVTSLQEFGMAQQFGAPPTFVGLDNYARIFSDDRLWA